MEDLHLFRVSDEYYYRFPLPPAGEGTWYTSAGSGLPVPSPAPLFIFVLPLTATAAGILRFTPFLRSLFTLLNPGRRLFTLLALLYLLLLLTLLALLCLLALLMLLALLNLLLLLSLLPLFNLRALLMLTGVPRRRRLLSYPLGRRGAFLLCRLRPEVLANNLANVNTSGFKKKRADFADLLYQINREPGAPVEPASMVPTECVAMSATS